MTSTENPSTEPSGYYNPFTGAVQSEPFIATDYDEDGYRIPTNED